MIPENIAFLMKISVILGLAITGFLLSWKYSVNGYEKMLRAERKKINLISKENRSIIREKIKKGE